MSHTPKPTPRRDGLNGEFYAHCARNELRFQCCNDCSTWRHMPRYGCAKCGSDSWTWKQSSGCGKLYSFTVTHRAFHPGFNDDTPYAVAVVEMDEGVRMVSQVVDAAPHTLVLDMPLEVVFVESEGVKLPKFQRRRS